jgi:replicative DNA helicase
MDYSELQDDEVAKVKIAPHSIEAEQSVLGGLMLDNNTWDTASEVLSEEHFYRHDHRLIYRIMQKLVNEQQPIDVVTLSEELDRTGDLDKAGGLDYLVELARNTPSASNIRAYAEIVRDRALLRQMIGVAQEISDNAFFPEGRAPEEILNDAEQKIFQIAENRPNQGGPEPINPLLKKAVDRIDYLFNNSGELTGVTTGFDNLDDRTAGLQPSDLIIVAARPSMGKTTFAMNLVENALMATNRPVLVFSLEMPADQLISRMLSSVGRIDQTKIRTGQLDEEDWPKLIFFNNPRL